MDPRELFLRLNKDKPFVNRVLNPKQGGSVPLGGRGYATHQMAAEYDQNMVPYAFPMYQQRGPGMEVFTDPQRALSSALRDNNAIQFDNIEDAVKFSQDYKTPEFKEYWKKRYGY